MGRYLKDWSALYTLMTWSGNVLPYKQAGIECYLVNGQVLEGLVGLVYLDDVVGECPTLQTSRYRVLPCEWAGT